MDNPDPQKNPESSGSVPAPAPPVTPGSVPSVEHHDDHPPVAPPADAPPSFSGSAQPSSSTGVEGMVETGVPTPQPLDPASGENASPQFEQPLNVGAGSVVPTSQVPANEPPDKGGGKRAVAVAAIVVVVVAALAAALLIVRAQGGVGDVGPTPDPAETVEDLSQTPLPTPTLTTDTALWTTNTTTLGFSLAHPPEMTAGVDVGEGRFELSYNGQPGAVGEFVDGINMFISRGDVGGVTLQTVSAARAEEVVTEGVTLAEDVAAFKLGELSGYRFTIAIDASGEELSYWFFPLGDIGYFEAIVAVKDPGSLGYEEVIAGIVASVEEVPAATPDAAPANPSASPSGFGI